MEEVGDPFECSCTKAALEQEFCESCSHIEFDRLDSSGHVKWRQEIMSVECTCEKKIRSGDFCDFCSKAEFDRLMRLGNKTWLPAAFSYRCFCAEKALDTETCERCSRREFDKFIAGSLSGVPGRICNIGHVASSDCPMCMFLRKCTPGESEWNDFVLADFSHMPVYAPRLGLLHESHSGTSGYLIYADILPSDSGVYSGRCACPASRNLIDDNLIREWLMFCGEKHQNCVSKTVSRIPGMQVIDCYDKVIVQFTTGYEDYIALSYVWGTSKGKDTESNFELGNCPKLIQDAMAMVRRIGFRYMWVDRYCIPQHDETVRQTQIQNMGKIYAESILTIIVAAGCDPYYGIPGVSSTPRKQRPSVRVGRHYLVGIRPPADEIRKSKWNTRGWTYQEALLSKRRLVFTDTQTYFQCDAMRCTDGISFQKRHLDKTTQLHNFDIQIAFPERLRNTPLSLVHRISEFLQRDLSKECDAVDAMAGVLTSYNMETHGPSSLCGLPISPTASLDSTHTMYSMLSLCEALLWRANLGMERRPCFPSWTWAGWKLTKDQKANFTIAFRALDSSRGRICAVRSIKAEFSDGISLSWADQHDQILGLSRLGSYPVSLRIACWTFNWDPPAGFKIETRAFSRLLGLMLSYTEQGALYFLVVEQQEGTDVFERVLAGYMHRSGELISTGKPGRGVWAEIELEWKEIYLV